MAILFGVLSIVIGVIAPILFGIWGFVATVVFAILAGVFVVKAKKEGGKGTAGIVTAIIGVVLGLAGMGIMLSIASVATEEAKKLNLPILTEYAENLKFGVVGFVASVTKEGTDMDALSAELKAFSDSGTTAATTAE